LGIPFNAAGEWAKAILDGETIKGIAYFVQCDPQTVIRVGYGR